MKQVWVFVLSSLLLFSCGEETSEEQPARIVNAGTLVSGPTNGFHRIRPENFPSIAYPASGVLTMKLPRGVFEARPFPADVSFTVKTSQNATIEGEASFPRIVFLENRRFEGTIEDDGIVTSAIVGSFGQVTEQTVVQIEAFSYSLPVTAGIESNRVSLQSEQLIERTFDKVP